jgi:hypothetical protein
MITFMGGVLGDTTFEETSEALRKDTKALIQPLLDAMILEGSYSMKDACYNQQLINPPDNTCMHGSEWSKVGQKIMGGDLTKLNAGITTNDNFHQVYTTNPVHLPEIRNKCDGKTQCTLDTITVTENFYNRLNVFDTGETEIGAYEMKAKLMSRQSIQRAAGNPTADFHESDEVGNRCGDINQAALDWALKHASPDAI